MTSHDDLNQASTLIANDQFMPFFTNNYVNPQASASGDINNFEDTVIFDFGTFDNIEDNNNNNVDNEKKKDILHSAWTLSNKSEATARVVGETVTGEKKKKGRPRHRGFAIGDASNSVDFGGRSPSNDTVTGGKRSSRRPKKKETEETRQRQQEIEKTPAKKTRTRRKKPVEAGTGCNDVHQTINGANAVEPLAIVSKSIGKPIVKTQTCSDIKNVGGCDKEDNNNDNDDDCDDDDDYNIKLHRRILAIKNAFPENNNFFFFF